jgi:hypothetical protein
MPQQVTRLLVLFVLLGSALVLGRHYFIPETFGDLGRYRAAAINDVSDHEKKYAGHQECALCHSDVASLRASSHHAGVSCEVCHGPAANHVAAPMENKPTIPIGREACILCHEFNPSRPTGFPQVNPIAHNPQSACTNCHNPHAPEPPVTPEECSACHGQIARQKSVSHHANLACTTCHEAPDEHKLSPRTVRPTRPTTRAFCGACHAQEGMGSLGIPQVSLSSHGEGYLCWQCHYPHFPEIGS